MANSSTGTLYLRAAARSAKQALLDPIELLGIVIGDAQGRIEMLARVLEGREGDIERLQGRLDQGRNLGAAPLQAARGRRQRGHRRLSAGHRIMRIAQVAGDLFGLHHGGPPLGERGLLGGLRAQLRKLRHRVAQPIGFTLRALHGGALGHQRALAQAQLVPQELDRIGLAVEPPEGVEQVAMGRRIDFGARSSTLPWISSTSAAPRIFKICTLTGWSLTKARVRPSAVRGAGSFVIGLDVVRRRRGAHRVGARQIEGGRHLALLGPMAHQRGIAAGAERQRKGVEQDGFANGAGALAGQHPRADVTSRSSRSIRTMSRIERRVSMMDRERLSFYPVVRTRTILCSPT